MAHQRIQIIDSHTGGEPTRVVVARGPDLGIGTVAEQRDRFREQFDHYRQAIVCEPRGTEAMVGALLVKPFAPDSAAGVIFFNSVGYLGMCGHGSIGVLTTLAYMNRINVGEHRLETPAGVVRTMLHPDGRVSLRNLPSYRSASGVTVEVPGFGPLTGDVAYGGNWFFITENHRQPLERDHVVQLSDFCRQVRRAINRIHPEVDHIELVGPSPHSANHALNFVLCPGGAYDRSPCGTGTSAYLACLYAEGRLTPGQVWRQESITGSVFEGMIEPLTEPAPIPDGVQAVVPTITGMAYLTAEGSLLLDPADPICWGL